MNNVYKSVNDTYVSLISETGIDWASSLPYNAPADGVIRDFISGSPQFIPYIALIRLDQCEPKPFPID